MHKYSSEFLKSGLSLNTHIGCPLGCSYCILNNLDEFRRTPRQIATPYELVKYLYSNISLFVNGRTPIYINNRTDPFLRETIDSTYALLDELQSHHISSPIILITKKAPDNRITKYFQKLNILFFYTYTGMLGEDFNSSPKINDDNLAIVEQYVPFNSRFHYFRPIIPGRNDDKENIREIFIRDRKLFRAAVYGGIRLSDNNARRYHIDTYDASHKYIADKTERRIRVIAQETGTTILRHTSCAVALYMKWPDRMHYYNKTDHCLKDGCPNNENCMISRVYDETMISDKLSYITDVPYHIDGDRITFNGAINQEVAAFIRTTYGLQVSADAITLSPSEQQIV